VAVAHGDPLRIVLALRAHNLDHFLLHQLSKHAQSDAHRQGQQSLSRDRGKLPERLLHASRQLLLNGRGLRNRCNCLLHGGSSFELRRIASNAPQRSG
jgi:hypothetical protein